MMLHFIKRTTLYKKAARFLERVSLTTDRLCLNSSHFTAQSWNHFNTSPKRITCANILSAFGFIIPFVSSTLLTYFATYPILNGIFWLYPNLVEGGLCVLSLSAGVGGAYVVIESINLFSQALVDGLVSAYLLAKHFKTSIWEQILLEYQKTAHNDPTIEDLSQLRNLLEAQEDEECLESLQNRYQNAQECSKQLVSISHLLSQGKMSGLKEKLTWVALMPAEYHGTEELLMLRRRKIPLENDNNIALSLSPQKQSLITTTFRSLQAQFSLLHYFEKGEKEREKSVIPVLDTILQTTPLTPTVAGIIVSFSQPFKHPLLNKNIKADDPDHFLKEKVLKMRENEIQRIATRK